MPYIIFGLVILLWSINKTEADLRKLSYFAPLIFLLLLLAVGFIFSFVTGEELEKTVKIALLFSMYVIIIGYFYVIVVNLGYELFFSRDN